MVDNILVKELISAKKTEAGQLGISGKAKDIAQALGQVVGKKYGYLYTYEDGKLKISYDSWGPNVQIHWDEKFVFSNSLGEITTYRSDIEGWVAKIEKLYTEIIIPKKEQEKLKREEERREDVKFHWGIII